MARYFFDLYECGTVTEDDEGVDREGPIQARDEAVRSARAMMCGEIAEGRLCLSCRIDGRDDTGSVIISLPFSSAVTITGSPHS